MNLEYGKVEKEMLDEIFQKHYGVDLQYILDVEGPHAAINGLIDIIKN